jgi:hypothetical protein
MLADASAIAIPADSPVAFLGTKKLGTNNWKKKIEGNKN